MCWLGSGCRRQGRRLPLSVGRLQREVKARARGFILASVAGGRDARGSDGWKGQCVSAAEARFDLLHLRKDPFHYKSGTLGVIGP